MEELSYSLWAMIIGLSYFFIFQRLYKNADKAEQTSIKDVKYLSYAILMFFYAAVLHLFANTLESMDFANIVYEKGLISKPQFLECSDSECISNHPECVTVYTYIYYFLRTIISVINNIFLLLAIPFIQLDGKQSKYQDLIIKYINDRIIIWFIIFTELAVLVLIGGFSFLEKPSPLLLLAYDCFISTIVIALLAWFINTAFHIRGFKYLKWMALFTFALMLTTQILQFFPFYNIPPEFSGAISSTYKTLLIGLFVILLYTFQKKQKVEITKQETKIPSNSISIGINLSSSPKRSGLKSTISLSIKPFETLQVDFSSSRTLPIVLLKFLYHKKHNLAYLRVKPKNDNRKSDFTYEDKNNICERLAGKSGWLKSLLGKSLFKLDNTNHYTLSIEPENITIEGENDFIQELLKESRFK